MSKGYDNLSEFSVKISDDSMRPKIESGDLVTFKRVNRVIEWGNVYLIDTKDGAFLKRIYDDGDSLRCVSYNSEYPDFKVPKIDINGIYRVVGLLRCF
jgi:phage repressor protein C with HTH and peptisase S24 domain